MSPNLASAFAAGAGFDPGRLAFLAAGTVAALSLIWATWVLYARYVAWTEERGSAASILIYGIFAVVLIMILGTFVRP